MFAEVVWFPPQASTTATAVDNLLYFLLIVCGSVGVLVAIFIIGFSIRYRRRPGTANPAEMRGDLRLESFWSITPLLIFFVIFVWGAMVYFSAYRAPDHASVIYVVGKQWMWKMQHPEGQREINELHVAVGQPFKLMLTSEDVIHSFFVPAFRIHMDVLPGRYTTVWFKPTEVGTYHLFCSQYCGTDHAGMIGRVVVMHPHEYQAWLDMQAEGSMALQGRKTFLRFRCISCHSADANARAPVLEDLYGSTVHLRDGRKIIADDDYLREHILTPGQKIVAGWQNIMPTFQGQLKPEDVNELIAFIKSLNKGQTPRRVESFEPPTETPQIRPLLPAPPPPEKSGVHPLKEMK